MQGKLNRFARRALVTGSVAFVVWVVAGGGAEVLKDEVKRKETVRRVREKVRRLSACMACCLAACII